MPIEIVDYDPHWPERFEREAGRLKKALGHATLRIEHVGSTAVPGLGAKDTIDIQIAVADMDAHIETIEALGYEYVPDDESEHRFFKLKDGAGNHLFHVHVCEIGSEWERRHLQFRNLLRSDTQIARRYQDLKRELAARIEDRRTYAGAKTEFIRNVQQEQAQCSPPSAGL